MMLDSDTLWDRIAGSLHGLLVGDALGCPVSGWTREQIALEFGRLDRMVQLPGRRWRPRGLHGDDGQQALALLDAICKDPEHPERPFADLLVAMREAAPQRSGRFGLHRDVGRNFRHTVRSMVATGVRDAHGHATASAGNAAAMRIAPAALWYRDDPQLRNHRVVSLSAVTHSDLRGIGGALVVAIAIGHALNAKPPPVLTHRLLDDFSAAEAAAATQLGLAPDDRFSRLLAGLIEERRSSYNLDSLLAGIAKRAQTIGEPDRSVEATSAFAPCSVLTALAVVDCASNLEQAVSTAINLGGQTDTMGAIAGALAGARWGIAGIPTRWLDTLQATGTLMERVEKVVAHETGPCWPDLMTLERQWDALYDDRPRGG